MHIEGDDLGYRKVESKDHAWKPAPILGREMHAAPTTFIHRGPAPEPVPQMQQPNFVLPSAFGKSVVEPDNCIIETATAQPTAPAPAMLTTAPLTTTQPEPVPMQSSLPTFTAAPSAANPHEGKTIRVNHTTALPSTTTSASSKFSARKPTASAASAKKK